MQWKCKIKKNTCKITLDRIINVNEKCDQPIKYGEKIARLLKIYQDREVAVRKDKRN